MTIPNLECRHPFSLHLSFRKNENCLLRGKGRVRSHGTKTNFVKTQKNGEDEGGSDKETEAFCSGIIAKLVIEVRAVRNSLMIQKGQKLVGIH